MGKEKTFLSPPSSSSSSFWNPKKRGWSYPKWEGEVGGEVIRAIPKISIDVFPDRKGVKQQQPGKWIAHFSVNCFVFFPGSISQQKLHFILLHTFNIIYLTSYTFHQIEFSIEFLIIMVIFLMRTRRDILDSWSVPAKNFLIRTRKEL